jgi:hypothetical protein
MIQPVDLHRDLAGLPLLKERYGHPTNAESLKSFATLAAYRDGGIYATHFRGSSGWERHPHGNEVVQILGLSESEAVTSGKTVLQPCAFQDLLPSAS